MADSNVQLDHVVAFNQRDQATCLSPPMIKHLVGADLPYQDLPGGKPLL
jgi:hypothetical protein